MSAVQTPSDFQAPAVYERRAWDDRGRGRGLRGRSRYRNVRDYSLPRQVGPVFRPPCPPIHDATTTRTQETPTCRPATDRETALTSRRASQRPIPTEDRYDRRASR